MMRDQASAFMMDVALRFYVRHGLAIFPCQAKKPLCKNGLKDATANEGQIREWWTRWPKAQVGLPTGARNHLLVVDVDGPSGSEWIKKQNWPRTLTVETSPNRFQLYFKQPDGVATRNSAGKIAPQVDIRGDGGYCIGAFSFHHRTHKPYIIVRDISGAKETENPMLPWAEAPASLLALVTVNGAAPPVSGDADAIPQGRRHATMLALAGAFRARGFSPDTVLANLRGANRFQCKPPLPDDELRKLAQYVGGKPAGMRNQKTPETCAEVEIETFSRVEMEKVCWEWDKRIARGKLNLFVGDPEKGKSLVSIDAAARISTGTAWPDGAPCERGDVLILSCEDDASDTIAPRLLQAGADLSRVHRVKSVKVTLGDGQTGESFFSLERDLEKLDQAVEKFPNIRDVIFDPLSAYMGKIKTFVDTEVRVVLGPVAEFANRRRIAVLGIMHLRKSEAAALLRVSGSIAYVAAARVVWGFGLDPGNSGGHVMICVKNNLGPKAPALAYRIIGSPADPAVGVVEWLKDEVTANADDVLDNNPRRNAAYGKTLDSAKTWLQELLAPGPVPQQHIENAAKNDHFSWITVRRAKSALKVESRKASIGGGWLWALPSDHEGDQSR